MFSHSPLAIMFIQKTSRLNRVLTAALFVSAVLLASCSGSGNSKTPSGTHGISFDKTKVTILVGHDGVIPVPRMDNILTTIRPPDTENRGFYLSIDKPGVIYIDGLELNTETVVYDRVFRIYSWGPGNTTITAKTADREHQATCSVTVNPVRASGLELNLPSVRLSAYGGRRLLIAKLFPADAWNKNMRWVCDNPAVARLEPVTLLPGEELYYVVGVAPGNARITVTAEDSGDKAECALEVI